MKEGADARDVRVDDAVVAGLGAALRACFGAQRPLPAQADGDVDIPQSGRGMAALPQLWQEIVERSTKLASPWMMGHMDTAPHPAAALTDAVVSALNNNLLFRELSPFASRIEELLIDELATRLELPAPTPGVFCSGGSLANLTALFAACGGYARRAERERVALLMPQSAHASIARAAAVLGIPEDNVAAIDCEADGRVRTAALDDALAGRRHERAIVVAVLGGTVTGSVDELPVVADLCRRHGAWLHVDAVYGGALAYSARHRHFLAGLSQAHSVSVAPHKWLGVPRLCALALFPRCRDFDAVLGSGMPYSTGGQPHRGRWGLQGSRRADALTLWVLLQVLGREGLEAHIDASIELAAAFHDLLTAHPRAQPVHVPDLNVQAFRFGDPDRDGRLAHVPQRLEEQGRAWVSAVPWRGEWVLRAVLLNARTEAGHLHDLLASLTAAAR